MKVCICIVLFLACSTFAQDAAEQQSIRSALQDEESALDSLALYPNEIKSAILEAAANPELIVKLANMQQKSSESFRKFIVRFPRNTQEQFYELIRYPGLIESIVDVGSEQKKVDVVRDYPREVGKTALQLANNPNTKEVLVNVYHLNQSIGQVFNEHLAGYPEKTRQAFRNLIEYPEILTILHRNMDLTVLIASEYRKNPQFALAESKSQQQAATREYEQSLNRWKEELEQSPRALIQLEDAAKQYAEGKGWEAKEALNAAATEQPQTQSKPYSYWYGYPYWFEEPNWYSQPPYYHWGFYYAAGEAMVITALPSYDFVDWILGNPRNLSRYSELANLFLLHYEQDPDAADSFTRATGDWLAQQKQEIPQEWLKADANRVARLAEYGRLQREFKSENATSSKRREYVQVQADRYPGLTFKLSTPAERAETEERTPSLRLETASDWLMRYRAVDYQLSTWARPHETGRLISIPVVEE